MMTQNKKQTFIYSLIFLGIFAAMLPVILSNNYLRQDDLMWEIWPGMKMSQFGFLYYNTVFQLVRPLCMLSFFTTDLISITIHNAVYIRLFSVILLGIMGIMLYRWQLLFNPNKILAATFAICAFTLPPYQIFAATGNYFLIITALFLTFGAVFYWFYAFTEKNATTKKRYFFIGCALFFASLLEYPLSSMYAFTLFAIFYLNALAFNHVYHEKRKFLYFGTLATIGMMVFYYLFIRIFHKIFHVDLSYGRPAVVDTSHLFTRLMRIFDVLSWHSNMWLWDNTSSWKDSFILPLFGIFTFALLITTIKRGLQDLSRISKTILQSLIVIFSLFFLAYSPVMASPDLQITFRYAIATMPLLLYVLFWSIYQITHFINNPLLAKAGKTICALLFLCTTVFGIGYANLMLADGVVGPHEHDYAYIQQQLTDKVIPLLKQNKKVTLHAIDCDNGNSYHYAANVPTAFEYGMRICSYQQQIIGVVIHSLRRMGYASNYNRHNHVIYNDNEIIVQDTPWGNLIVNNTNDPHVEHVMNAQNSSASTLVTIDTKNAPTYQHFEFYKKLYQKISNFNKA